MMRNQSCLRLQYSAWYHGPDIFCASKQCRGVHILWQSLQRADHQQRHPCGHSIRDAVSAGCGHYPELSAGMSQPSSLQHRVTLHCCRAPEPRTATAASAAPRCWWCSPRGWCQSWSTASPDTRRVESSPSQVSHQESSGLIRSHHRE